MTTPKKKREEPEPTESMAADVHVLKPGARITVQVNLGDQRLEYVIQALEDGVLRVYQAPEPAPPVSTPNPISGT